MSALPLFFGRLHPLLVHFPVATIVFAAGLEAARLKWDSPLLGKFVTWLLVAGAATAFAASVTGWVFAIESYPRPALRWMLQWHRWLGIVTAVMAAVSAGLSFAFSDSPVTGMRWLRRGAIWLTAALLVAAAHLGALMVWGEDYFDPAS